MLLVTHDATDAKAAGGRVIEIGMTLVRWIVESELALRLITHIS